MRSKSQLFSITTVPILQTATDYIVAVEIAEAMVVTILPTTSYHAILDTRTIANIILQNFRNKNVLPD